ncbi:hypothetical protein LQK80_07770 [Bacillus thuringiensis]|nr:hypothetical protein [Bacillus thuringiensis]
MQNSIHKQILFLFFLFLILIIVFSFILHTPKDVPNSVSFINYCSRIVVIEEGAFYRAPLKSLFSYNFTETKIDAMSIHIEPMNNKVLYN